MRRALTILLVFSLACMPLLEYPTASASTAPLPQDDSYYEPYSPEQLDNLLAPVALYPDPLLAQVLVAATFVDEIDEAARWVRAEGQNGIDDQPWDVSVKAVAHYPAVLYMMDSKLNWTTAVGQAYVNQSTDVMTSVQRLRSMAYAQGNLPSTPEQQVIVEGGYYQIVPVQPQYVFVPTYDPTIVFFRPAYVRGVWLPGAFFFGAGILIGVWLNRDCDWREHRVYYHGWEGGGWVERCRPYVHVTNVYVNNNYRTVIVNRTVVNRTVNITRINNYNSIHREVNFDNHVRNEQRGANQPNRINNDIINRNMNTNDPRLDQYRGRANEPARSEAPRPWPESVAPSRPGGQPERPESVAPSRPALPPPRPNMPPPRPAERPQPPPPPPPHAFGKSESKFDPHESSQRGQESRKEASRPAPPPREPSKPSGRPPRGHE